MNEDEVEDRWERLRGRVNNAWGGLTEDDFTKSEGSVDKLYGIFLERYGNTNETIKEKLDAIRRK